MNKFGDGSIFQQAHICEHGVGFLLFYPSSLVLVTVVESQIMSKGATGVAPFDACRNLRCLSVVVFDYKIHLSGKG